MRNMGPLFAYRSDFTEAEVIRLTQPGEDELRRRARHPDHSFNQTHRGPGRWEDRPDNGDSGQVPNESVTWAP